MDLSTFYAIMAGTCFTLVGLWWTVVERHPSWKADRHKRALAGGVYLSFLLPGLMGTLAQVSPDTPALWRISFGACALAGLYSTAQLLRIDHGTGSFRRFRWVVGLLYLLVLVLGVAPELARAAGFTPLIVGSILLVLLIVIAHGLTWEFMMEPDEEPAVT